MVISGTKQQQKTATTVIKDMRRVETKISGAAMIAS